MTKTARIPRDFYGGVDPRDAAAYTLADAARYLRVPASTLRAWAFGQTQGRKGRFERLFPAQFRDTRMLSFKGLVSAHVLSALRTQHQIPMQRVRKALRFLKTTKGLEWPLIEMPFLTDGADIFIEELESTVNASRLGQLALRPMLDAYLKRIQYDGRELVRLYPFIRRPETATPAVLDSTPRFIVMDPKIAFGRPVIAGTSVRTSIIASRHLAGESFAALAEDYDQPVEAIEEAIRCESIAA